jgi:hypothetical protein
MDPCENCGKELVEGVKFCSNCGTAIGGTIQETLTVASEKLVEEIKKILHEGNLIKVIVQDENGKTLLEIPAWAGIVGAVMAPWLAALGAIAAIATKCKIIVIRTE